MRKTFRFLTIAVVLTATLLFSSCQKEWEYTPKHKISTISVATTIDIGDGPVVQPIQLYEMWAWEGKLLQSITRQQNYLQYTFEYDQKRVSRISSSQGGYALFTYEGDELIKMEDYTNYNQLVYSEEYSYEKGKISDIKVYILTDLFFKEGNTSSFGLLNYIAPSFDKLIPRSNTKDGETIRNVTLQWENDNIVEIVLTEDDTRTVATYTYDDKINPYYGAAQQFILGTHATISKNNIITEKITNNAGVYNSTFEYVYDGSLPVQRINDAVTVLDGETITQTQTLYFDYE